MDSQTFFAGSKTEGPQIITQSNLADALRGLPMQANIALKSLTLLQKGALTLQLPNGKSYRYQGVMSGPDATLIMHNWGLARRAISNGSIGVAESYMDGDWESPDVSAFLELFCVNEQLGTEMVSGRWFFNAITKIRHWLNDNTKRGSKKNISAHYDLGNNFYSEWLDPTMTYSSALYQDGANDLESAQKAKYRALAEATGIKMSDHVLEIGCGWGGFAQFAASEIGCKVTCLTISQEQFDFATERMKRCGLEDLVEIKFQDYRDEIGTYDRIVSIEMFEAVGEKYWDTYFDQLNKCLRAGGKAGLQIITINDKDFEDYRMRPDFIQRYVFPGGMLPSPTALSQMADKFDLKLSDERIFGRDYARTLAEWRVRFWDKWHLIQPMGFDDRFKRLWEFYFHYCEAGFNAGNIDVRQMVYAKS